MKGHFDYLNEYCKVVYLERTKGISSTQIRNSHSIRLGIIGDEQILDRFLAELNYVSGIEPVGVLLLIKMFRLCINRQWQKNLLSIVRLILFCQP